MTQNWVKICNKYMTYLRNDPKTHPDLSSMKQKTHADLSLFDKLQI